MKYVLFDRCVKKGITDILHKLLFHGSPYPEEMIHRFGEPANTPLLVAKGGRDWPEIFMPSRSLVVSEKAAAALDGVKNIEYYPVVFSKLINMKCMKGEFFYYESDIFLRNPEKNRSDKIIENMDDAKFLHESIPSKYSELVVPNIYRLLNEQDDFKKVSIKIPHLSSNETQVRFSAKMFDEYPIYSSSLIVMQRDCFDKISSLIDVDFFTFAEFDF